MSSIYHILNPSFLLICVLLLLVILLNYVCSLSYGWASFPNVSSLISGVGIFCVGAGLSYYHGILGLIHGVEVESLGWVSIVNDLDVARRLIILGIFMY